MSSIAPIERPVDGVSTNFNGSREISLRRSVGHTFSDTTENDRNAIFPLHVPQHRLAEKEKEADGNPISSHTASAYGHPEFELVTSFDGKLGAEGAMFDVVSKPNNVVSVTGFSFHTKEQDPACNVRVYTKEGTHRGHETKIAEWEMIVNGVTQCMGPGLKTEIRPSIFEENIEDHLRIHRGQRRAFYIIVSKPLRYTKTDNADGVFVEDDHIKILEGSGVATFFSNMFSPRTWNGILKYIVEEKWSGSFELGNTGEDDDGDPFKGIGCPDIFETSLVDSTGSFGHMFNIKANADDGIIIDGLEFHTDRSYNLNYEIYTRVGGFESGTTDLVMWTEIAKGVVKGAGRGKGTVVTGRNFRSVLVESGETQGFFITLDTEDLRYTNATGIVGALPPEMSNNHLSVSTGVGVGSYPLGEKFFFPRSWNGRVIYKTMSECQDTDTMGAKTITTVNYNFVVEHPKLWSDSDLFEYINDNVKGTVVILIEEDPDLVYMVNSNTLQLDSVNSNFDRHMDISSCEPSKSFETCSAVITTVALSHDEGVDGGKLIYELLRFSDKVSSNLALGRLSVYYAGDKSLETSTVITMEGVPNYAMGLSETNLFEMITKTHLNDLVTENDAQILTVEVRSQFLDAARTKSSPLDRFLQATSSTLDVTTIITGKHRPPPELNFDKLIEDSINADTVLFEDALAKGSLEEGGEYFNDIEEIVAKPAPKVIKTLMSPTPAPTQLPGLSSGGIGIGMSILIVIGIALATFALVLGIFITRKRQREKSRQKSHHFFDHDEDDPLFFDVFSSKKQGIPHPHEVSFGENGNRKSASRRSIETEPMTSSETSNQDYRYSTRRFREDDIDHNGNEADEDNDPSDCDLPMVRKDRMTRGGSKTRLSSRDLQSRQNSSRERNHTRAISNSSYSNASETSYSRRRSSEESLVGSVTSNFSQHSKFKEVNGFYPPKRRASTAHSRRRSDIEDEHEDRIRRKYHAKSLSEKQTKREREDYASVNSQPGPSRHYSRTLKSERKISRSSSRSSSNDFGDKRERNIHQYGYNSDKSDNKESRRERPGHIERHGNSKIPSSFSDGEENVSIASMSTDSTISTKVQLR